MSQLTYKELEILHYALRMFIEDSNNKDSFNSLHNKLIRMRAELEYPKQSTITIRLVNDNISVTNNK